MSDAEDTTAGGPTSANLGVVDPLRVPGLDGARRRWANLPGIGRAFVIAAAVDFLVRLAGIGGLPSYADLGSSPVVLLSFLLPHTALLLLPAIVVARRPDAARATPLLLWGAITLALVELLSGPLGLLFSPAGPDITAWTALQLVTSIARGGAYLALAVGLLRIDRSVPTPTLAGFANLAGALIAIAAIVSILVQVLGPQSDFGVPEWSAQFLLTGIVAQLPVLAFAYLARAAIRGASDTSRPRAATVLAAGAMTLSGIDAFLALGFGVLLLLQTAFAISAPVIGGGFAFGFLGGGMVLGLLVVAFGLGLGDASATIPRIMPPEESRA